MPQKMEMEGLYQLPKVVMNSSVESRFDYIFKNRVWGTESFSGSGSTMLNTSIYRAQLKQFLNLNGNRKLKFFDAPCGDLHWIISLIDEMEYIGGDISGYLIEHIKKDNPELNLLKFDIINDAFPDADVWHCRHCLFHLSLADISKTFENFCKSNIESALITNHFLPDVVAFNIPSGSFRELDLMNFPFYLPKPKMWLLDSEPNSGKVAVATGLWKKSDIEIALKNYRGHVQGKI